MNVALERYINGIDKEKMINIKERDFSFMNEYIDEGGFDDSKLNVTSKLDDDRNCEVVIIAF
jgi:hypothetical protein